MKTAALLVLNLSMLAQRSLAAQRKVKLDRRFAVVRGPWSSEAVSLFNTWGALNDNPGRKLALYSPDHKKIVHVDGEKVSIRIDGKEYKTDFSGKTNAELG